MCCALLLQASQRIGAAVVPNAVRNRFFITCVMREMSANPNPHSATPEAILLVEDEVLLCWVLEEALREDGYTVHIATTGDGGMEAVESGQRFAALVTNIRLKDGPD